jgi:two-component system, NtrC family, response regulator AlgB
MLETTLNILIVDDELNIRKTLTLFLESEGHKVRSAGGFDDALAMNQTQAFDMAFVDLRLGTDSGLDLIPALLAASPWLKIVVITAYASIDTAVEAIKRGAADYIPKPFTPAQVKLAVDKIANLRTLEQRIEGLKKDLGKLSPELDLFSESPVMLKTIETVKQVAGADSTVLLTGENGSGKSVLARTIHSLSPRADRPFAEISCPSLSAELIESELFGHVRGSFTGAIKDTPGRIAACEGGTLFLDEIGDLPVSIQPKLLRFIQEKSYERLGENITKKADIRLITATNTDLELAVKERRFREDLFYRLNVIQIEIPPLRERIEDIAPIASRLLTFFARNNHRTSQRFSDEALEALKRYPWPGNIRELRNVVERASILCKSETVDIEYLPEKLTGSRNSIRPGDRVSLDKIEEMHIRSVLSSARSLQEASEILGVDQATLWRKRKRYNI